MNTYFKLTIGALSVLGSSVAFAEGSSWGSLSTSPTEDNNVLATVFAEQSKVATEGNGFKLSPFVSGTVSVDSKGLDWNNKAVVRAGGKVDYPVDGGILTLRMGYAFENRLKSGDNSAGAFASAEYWFGWGQGGKFPGSSWGVIGNLSPSEKGNINTMIHVQQGIMAHPYEGGNIVPFIDVDLVRDTKKHDWNNKNVLGLGVKYSKAVGTGVVDVGVKWQHETRVRSGKDSNGVVLFATYWFGW